MPPQDERRHNAPPPAPADLEKTKALVAAWSNRWNEAYFKDENLRQHYFLRINEEIIPAFEAEFLRDVQAGTKQPAPQLFDALLRKKIKEAGVPVPDNFPPVESAPEAPMEDASPAASETPPVAPPAPEPAPVGSVEAPPDAPAGTYGENAEGSDLELAPEIARTAEKIADERTASFPGMSEDLKKEMHRAAMRLARDLARGADRSEAAFRRMLQFDPEWLQLERIARERNASAAGQPPSSDASAKNTGDKPIRMKGFDGLAALQFPPENTKTPPSVNSDLPQGHGADEEHAEEGKPGDKVSEEIARLLRERKLAEKTPEERVAETIREIENPATDPNRRWELLRELAASQEHFAQDPGNAVSGFSPILLRGAPLSVGGDTSVFMGMRGGAPVLWKPFFDGGTLVIEEDTDRALEDLYRAAKVAPPPASASAETPPAAPPAPEPAPAVPVETPPATPTSSASSEIPPAPADMPPPAASERPPEPPAPDTPPKESGQPEDKEDGPATKEPPSAIEGNGEPVEPGRKPEGTYSEADKAAAERAEAAKAINAKGEEFRRKTLELRVLEGEIAKRKLTDKEFGRLRALRPEREVLVKELVTLAGEVLGEEEMSDAVKWADPEYLKEFSGAVKGLSDEERKKRIAGLPEEVRAAKALEGKLRRKFESALERAGVSGEIAHTLYREYFDRAIQLCRFADQLNANDAKALEKLSKQNVHIEHLLDFHGIAERDPEKLKDALAPIVGRYRTPPERKKERAPQDFLSRARAAAEGGEEIPAHVLYNVLRQGRSPAIVREGGKAERYSEGGTKEERAWAKEELRRRGLDPEVEPNEENPHWWAEEIVAGRKPADSVPKHITRLLHAIARSGKRADRKEKAEHALEFMRNARKTSAEEKAPPPWPWPTSEAAQTALGASASSAPQEVSGSEVRDYLFTREMDDARSELRRQGAQFPKEMAKDAGIFLRMNDEISAWEKAAPLPSEEKREAQRPSGEPVPSPAPVEAPAAAAQNEATARLPGYLRGRVGEVEQALKEHPETVPDAIVAEFAKAGFPWAAETSARRAIAEKAPPSAPQKPAKGNGQKFPGDSGLDRMEEAAYIERLKAAKLPAAAAPSPLPESKAAPKEQEQETAFAAAMREVGEGKRTLALEPKEEEASSAAVPKKPSVPPPSAEVPGAAYIDDQSGSRAPMTGMETREDDLVAQSARYWEEEYRKRQEEREEFQKHMKDEWGIDTSRDKELSALDATGEAWAHFIEVNYGDKSLAEARETLRGEEAAKRNVDEAAAAGSVAAVVAAEASAAGAPAEEPKALTPEVLKRYEEEFRVPAESLAAIPEFTALTEGERLLVLRDLNRTMIGRIRARALKDYRDKFEALGGLTEGEKRFLAEGKTMTGKWWRRFAVGMLQIGKKSFWKKIGMSLMKEKLIADKENEIKTALREKKFDHTALVRELARNAKRGPEAEMVDGKLVLKFVKESDFGGPLTFEEAARVAAFNKTAAAWMDMPHAFAEPGASERDRAAYEAAKTAYTRALYDVLELKRLKLGERSSAIDTLDLDRRITLSQFFNAYPGEAERFAELKNTSAWWRWIRSTALMRTKAFAMGAAVRTVAAGTIASVAAPVAAIAAAPVAGAFVGRSLGRKRAEIELEEREAMAKMGVRDAGAEAKNIVDVAALAQKIERMKAAIAEIPADTQDPALEEKRDDLICSLEARYWYTKEKIEKGLINFGDDEAEAHRNRFALAQALGTAIGVAEVEQQWNNRIKKRLRRFVDYKERIIKTREGAFVDERGKMAATYGAIAAGAGAVIADVIASGMTGRGASAELFGVGKKEGVAVPPSAALPAAPSAPALPEQEPYPFVEAPDVPKSAPSAPSPAPEASPVPAAPPAPEILTFERLPSGAQEEAAAQFFLLGRTPSLLERDALAFLSYMRSAKEGDAAEILRYDDTYRALVRAMELREGVPLPDPEVRRILEEAGVGERMRQYFPQLWGMRSPVAAPGMPETERVFPVQMFTAETIRKNIAEVRELLSGGRAPSAPEAALYGRLKFLGEHPPEGLTPRDAAEALERFKELLRAKGRGELTEAELEDFLRREKLERYVPVEYLKPLFGKPLPR